MQQCIRIIGGSYRGKKITFPSHATLRPTPNRIRETLFNWLMHDIRGARCLDAFAGSGALGLEAFSRGAHTVIFLEQDINTYLHLKKNIDDFHSNRLTIIHTDALQYLNMQSPPFDIIFLDPPFNSQLQQQCIALLSASNILRKHGLLYIESPIPMILDSTQWELLHAKQAGQVAYALYRNVY